MTTAVGVGSRRSRSRRLVGRDGVLAHLQSMIEESSAGHRPVTVLIEGPAGIGKTRVIDEWAARLGDRADVLVGHCVALGEQTLPFAPLVDLLGEARRSRLRLTAAESAGNPYRLTSRESEVLGLVCQGLTDRQIGTRLFISPRTAERHVSNLLAKLGVQRRSELIAAAHRDGLAEV